MHTGYKFQSNTTIYYAKCPYGNMFRLCWVIIRPSKEQIQCIKIYSAFWDPKRLSIWDPNMHYKFWYIGSVLWKAWWWLNRVETCCHKDILCNKFNVHGSVYRNNILVYNSNKMHSHRVYLIWQLLYMFRASLSPIFRSTKQL